MSPGIYWNLQEGSDGLLKLWQLDPLQFAGAFPVEPGAYLLFSFEVHLLFLVIDLAPHWLAAAKNLILGFLLVQYVGSIVLKDCI
jgi:hypothetical protein